MITRKRIGTIAHSSTDEVGAGVCQVATWLYANFLLGYIIAVISNTYLKNGGFTYAK